MANTTERAEKRQDRERTEKGHTMNKQGRRDRRIACARNDRKGTGIIATASHGRASFDHMDFRFRADRTIFARPQPALSFILSRDKPKAGGEKTR